MSKVRKLCKHKRREEYCKECGGRQVCPHLRTRAQCRECGGSAFCVHDKWKPDCPVCNPASLFRRYRASAIKRDIAVRLTPAEFQGLVLMPCIYCGQTPAGGVDRLNSTQGYSVENCAPCCTVDNRMKLMLSYEEFLTQVRKVYLWQHR